ncbi:MAG: molybdopterin molybdotransferase MoeA [Candidatus Dormibacteraeota bacterium]|nr:molybdopterin molybdotransferase MoeA [Candidatus Dormibacteraeota bacterium]
MTVTQTAPERLESVAAAQSRLLDIVRSLDAEDVALERAAGRVLAAPVVARWDLPGFDNSAMDGYAVRASEVAGAVADAPVRLPVRGEVAAGRRAGALAAGTAMRIFTGAALPAGADAVVRQEDTRRDGDDVLIEVAVAPGTAVRRRGEDITTGTVVLQPGGRVSPADIAVAAAAGSGALRVGRRPRVAVVAAGDELRPAGSDLDGAQVADSNSPMIAAAVREAGGEPVLLGIASDDPAVLRQTLRTAMESSDLIVSSAGVSVGDHDHVREVLADLGEIGVWRVAMRPGKPLLIGRAGAVPFIGLPGNPVSSSVTFELFARPAILRLQGAADVTRRRVRVRLGEDIAKPAGLETYARARLVESGADLPVALSSGGQGSHMISALVAADVLLVLPAETASMPRGAVVEAIPLR